MALLILFVLIYYKKINQESKSVSEAPPSCIEPWRTKDGGRTIRLESTGSTSGESSSSILRYAHSEGLKYVYPFFKMKFIFNCFNHKKFIYLFYQQNKLIK